MSKPITGKTTTSVWKQKRKNGDIYVWERQTVYIPETRKTKELSRKLLGKIPAGSTHQAQTQKDRGCSTSVLDTFKNWIDFASALGRRAKRYYRRFALLHG